MGIFYGYARVSTEVQSDYSIEHQLNYLKRIADSLHLDFIPMHEKASGKDIEGRQVLQEILSKAKEGDCVGFYDNSRLGRDVSYNLQIMETFKRNKVRVFIGGQEQRSDSQSEFMFTIDSAVSTLYRKQQLQKTLDGLKGAKESGDFIFTNIFGYDQVKKRGNTIVSLNPTESKYVKYIYEQFTTGKTIQQLTHELYGLPEFPGTKNSIHSKIRGILSKPIYMGYYPKENGDCRLISKMSKSDLQNILVKSNKYPQIIDEEMWWKSFEIRKKGSWKNLEIHYGEWELSGIIRCKHCNMAAHHRFAKKRVSTNLPFSYYMVEHREDTKCNEPNLIVNATDIERIVRGLFYLTFNYGDEVGKFFESKRVMLNEDKEELEKAIEQIDREIDEINSKKEKLIDLILDGTLSREHIQKKMNELEEAIRVKQGYRKDYEFAKSLKEEVLEELIQESSVDMVELLLNTSDRKNIYRNILTIKGERKATVKLGIEFKNGKRYLVECPLKRTKNSIYQIKMEYNGTLQEEFFYQVNDSLFHWNCAENSDEFKQYAINEFNRLLSGTNGYVERF